ncbi:MAG: hypothetical protein Q9163_005144 [Psora crenata]
MYLPTSSALLAPISLVILGLTISKQVITAPMTEHDGLVPRQQKQIKGDLGIFVDQPPPAEAGPGSDVFACKNPPIKQVWVVNIDRPFSSGGGCSALENAIERSGSCSPNKYECTGLDNDTRTRLRFETGFLCDEQLMEAKLNPLIAPASLDGQFLQAKQTINDNVCDLNKQE